MISSRCGYDMCNNIDDYECGYIVHRTRKYVWREELVRAIRNRSNTPYVEQITLV